MSEWTPSGHVTVLGLGVSGEAAAVRLLAEARKGAPVRVSVSDEKDTPILRERAERLRKAGATVELGVSAPASDADLVVTSPGIPPTSGLLTGARALGTPVISEIELAYRLSSSPFVAVTGTNGKTTTTALVTHLMRASGIPAEAVGNIGTAASAASADAGPATVLVAEVSSFQLAMIDTFRPRVSVLLNITPDHIEYHGSLERYAADKARVFLNQGPGDVAVIDVDDAGSRVYADTVEGQGVEVVRVSRTSANRPGATLVDGVLTIMRSSGDVPLVRVDELSIRGEHNVSNALAAAAAALAAGATPEGIREGLRTFTPVEHRLEPVDTVDGVEYFNDSKATNPDAVFKALTAFEGRPLILLLGGYTHESDFKPLARAVSAACRAAILFGEARPLLDEAFAGLECEVHTVAGMSDAVLEAADIAQPGDVVMLSPACKSFDEFEDYGHRGRVFKEIVRGLPRKDARA